MRWSRYSEALFSAFVDTTDNLIVQACPGAGKTTNIKELWNMTDKPTVYLVFNKHNQLEAEAKLPARPGSSVLTLNGLGHRAVMNTFGNVKLDDRKVINIIRDKRKRYAKLNKQMLEREYMLNKAVAVAKCVDVDGVITDTLYNDMLNTYDLDSYEGMKFDVAAVLKTSDEQRRVIDFADQLRFPVIYDCAMPEYHTVLGDEVQDFNPVQAAMLQFMQAERYVLVGDTHQSIYGFRGAMNGSMRYLKRTFHCIELPLSITYRCAKAVTAEAAKIYSDIEPWEESPQGIVRQSAAHQERYSAEDIVLCRLNRPLIALAYELLGQDVPCHVRGRDIGQGLIRLIRKQSVGTVRALTAALEAECETEIARAVRWDDPAREQRVTDRYSSALLFCGKCPPGERPDVVIAAIESLFEHGRGVCLTTVHKAKGLEAQRACLLETALFDHCAQRARQAWQVEQERNVLYVAVTRAKHELVYM